MKKILVTGHKGFIGGHVTKALEARGYAWVGWDLKDGNDVRDLARLDRLFEEENFDAIIHLAALAGVRRSEKYREEYLSTNVMGSDNILKMADEYGVGRVILFSSSSVIGESGVPISFYGATKRMMEDLPYRYAAKYLVPTTRTFIVRPFTVYGENGRGDQVIYKWLNQLRAGRQITFFGDGDSKRGYTYVGDLVDGVMKLLEYRGEKPIDDFDFGGAEVVSLNELLDIFREVFPDIEVKRQDRNFADIKTNFADLAKARELLEWEPKQNFKEKVLQIITSQE